MSEQTLDQVVENCQHCESDCSRRADRFITDVSLSPAISKSVTDNNAKARRDDAFSKCMEACKSVLAQCPSPSDIRTLIAQQTASSSTTTTSGNNNNNNTNSPVMFHEPQFQLRRCEGAVGTYVSVLFWMANAPTKYELEIRDYTEQRQAERNAAKNGTSLAAKTGATGAAAGGVGAVAAQFANLPGSTYTDENGEVIIQGTAHLPPEARKKINELAAKSDPSKVTVFGGGRGGRSVY